MTICSDEPEEVAPQAPPRRVAARVGGTRRNRTMRAQVEYARRMRGEVIDEEDEDDEEGKLPTHFHPISHVLDLEVVAKVFMFF